MAVHSSRYLFFLENGFYGEQGMTVLSNYKESHCDVRKCELVQGNSELCVFQTPQGLNEFDSMRSCMIW